MFEFRSTLWALWRFRSVAVTLPTLLTSSSFSLFFLILFPELVRKLEACLKLNEAYEEQYKLTKAKLEQNPKGKQFTFDEMQIFGKFKLFCRRVIKLIDMFSTIDQFNSLSKNKLEGTNIMLFNSMSALNSMNVFIFTILLIGTSFSYFSSQYFASF